MPKARTFTMATKKYSPVMGQRLINVLSEGKDVAHFLEQEQIPRDRFRIWVKKYPEFKEAYEIAEICKRVYSLNKVELDKDVKIENMVAYKAYLYHCLGLREDKEPNINIDVNNVSKDIVSDISELRKKWESDY